jgi:hypothetical protein
MKKAAIGWANDNQMKRRVHIWLVVINCLLFSNNYAQNALRGEDAYIRTTVVYTTDSLIIEIKNISNYSVVEDTVYINTSYFLQNLMSAVENNAAVQIKNYSQPGHVPVRLMPVYPNQRIRKAILFSNTRFCIDLNYIEGRKVFENMKSEDDGSVTLESYLFLLMASPLVLCNF